MLEINVKKMFFKMQEAKKVIFLHSYTLIISNASNYRRAPSVHLFFRRDFSSVIGRGSVMAMIISSSGCLTHL